MAVYSHSHIVYWYQRITIYVFCYEVLSRYVDDMDNLRQLQGTRVAFITKEANVIRKNRTIILVVYVAGIYLTF